MKNFIMIWTLFLLCLSCSKDDQKNAGREPFKFFNIRLEIPGDTVLVVTGTEKAARSGPTLHYTESSDSVMVSLYVFNVNFMPSYTGPRDAFNCHFFKKGAGLLGLYKTFDTARYYNGGVNTYKQYYELLSGMLTIEQNGKNSEYGEYIEGKLELLLRPEKGDTTKVVNGTGTYRATYW
jgi:hypothetical protein